MTEHDERPQKEYPRLRAPVYFTRTMRALFRRRRTPSDALGGVSVYTDEEPPPGAQLKAEIFLPDGSSVVCRTEVAWVEKLSDGGPARCEVGLKFTAIHPLDRARLSGVLDRP
jgi:PilZ domain